MSLLDGVVMVEMVIRTWDISYHLVEWDNNQIAQVHNLRIGLDILQGAQITQLYLARG
jgi:hypothetical protein